MTTKYDVHILGSKRPLMSQQQQPLLQALQRELAIEKAARQELEVINHSIIQFIMHQSFHPYKCQGSHKLLVCAAEADGAEDAPAVAAA